MYIYMSHMGGLFTSNNPLSYKDLYCETCGDSDDLIGYAETKEEAWKLLEYETDINGSGGLDYDYVMKFIDEMFEEE